MNLQVEVNRAKFALESLTREIERQNFLLEDCRVRLGSKPQKRTKLVFDPVVKSQPTSSEMIKVHEGLGVIEGILRKNSETLTDIRGRFLTPAQMPIVSENKKVIYSALFGDYDNWLEPEFECQGWDHILFTDQPIVSDRYQVVYMEHQDKLERKIKIAPHLFKELKNYEVWAWMDASIKPLKDIDEFVRGDFTILKHPNHDCIYQEAEACIQAQKDKKEVIESQVEHYKKSGFPTHQGMCASGFHIKKNTPEVVDFGNQWLAEVMGGSRRDQLSFNYVVWKTKMDINYLPWPTLYQYFKFRQHKKRKKF